MGRRLEVPITPAVLDWAIAESGLSLAELATGVGVDERDVQNWLSERAKPSVTELKRLAKTLHRQVAVFLLPSAPASPRVHVQFRHPITTMGNR